MAASRKKKAEFTEEQTKELVKAYDGGMNTVSKSQLPKIQAVADSMERDVVEIKNWIGNERGRRKRKASSDIPSASKPPQKIRAPNCYNLFTKDFCQTPEGKAISDFTERNKVAAMKWREMSEEDVGKYKQVAAQTSTAPPGPLNYDKWHETRRILSNLQQNCEWAKRFDDIHILYIVCNEKNHYVGGTQTGEKYLENNAHIPASFLVSTKPDVNPMPPKPCSKKQMRSLVLQQLNANYSLAVSDPQAKIPFKLLGAENVCGWPPGVPVIHPSNMAHDDLAAVFENIASIKFVGVPPKVPYTSSEHSYCKDPSPDTSTGKKKSNCQGHTTLSNTSNQKDRSVSLEVPSSDTTKTCVIGASIQLLTESYSPVGTAITMSGNQVHGHDLPNGFVRVAINRIDAEVRPFVKGNDIDEYLTSGSITAWPVKFTRRM